MNNDVWKGKWKQLKGEIQKQWGNLTNDDLDKLQGDRKKIEGLLQERYGIAKNEVTKKLDEIEKRYS
jgi:uncharacterized protein YjbJ (UPF0337 family)